MRQSAERPRVVAEDSGAITGSTAAALVAAGIGSAMVGLMTTLAAASTALSNSLRFVAPVGPLSGKTIVAVIVWLLAWAILHFAWRGGQKQYGGVFLATIILIALGVLGTFPIFFDLFAPA